MKKPNIVMEEIENFTISFKVNNNRLPFNKINKNINDKKDIYNFNLKKENQNIIVSYDSISSHKDNIDLFLLNELNKYNKALFIYKIDTNKYFKNINRLKKDIYNLPSVNSINFINFEKDYKGKNYKNINLNNSDDFMFMIISLSGNPDEFNVYSVVYNYLKMNI